MREWVAKNQDIVKTRLDSEFLLLLLRTKKFSVTMAQELMERFLILLMKERDGVHYFRNLDFKSGSALELINLGWFLFQLV